MEEIVYTLPNMVSMHRIGRMTGLINETLQNQGWVQFLRSVRLSVRGSGLIFERNGSGDSKRLPGKKPHP